MHDVCYGTCGANKDGCDSTLLRKIDKICNTLTDVGVRRCLCAGPSERVAAARMRAQMCKQRRDLLYQAVHQFGSKHFIDIQASHPLPSLCCTGRAHLSSVRGTNGCVSFARARARAQKQSCKCVPETGAKPTKADKRRTRLETTKFYKQRGFIRPSMARGQGKPASARARLGRDVAALCIQRKCAKLQGNEAELCRAKCRVF